MIRYVEGYEYQLHDDYTVQTAVRPEGFILTRFIRLDMDGVLSIVAGYAWDGPSGPAIDSRNFMRGSLVHDALYQLMREGHLDAGKWRAVADEELVRLCKEDGMWALRRAWVLAAVRTFAARAATRQPERVLTAP